jgi:hypothetical protein
MSFITNLEAKLSEVKGKVEGDLHSLVLRLESVFQRVQQSPVEEVIKEAIVSDIHAAATHIETVADTLRSNVDVVDAVVDAADNAVKKAATK